MEAIEEIEKNNISTQEQIEKIGKVVEYLKKAWDSVVKAVKEISIKLSKAWNTFLESICKYNKKIRKIRHIYIHTKKNRIKKKQIARLYEILKE